LSNLVVFGTGGHSESVYEIAMLTGRNVIAFIDPESNSTEKFGINVYSDFYSLLNEVEAEFSVFVAVGENSIRKKIVSEILEVDSKIQFDTLIHPRASVSGSCYVGEGTVIMNNASIGANCRIFDFVILGSGSSIDHGCEIGMLSQLGPGVTLAGNVTIDENVFIGAGSTLIQGIQIDANTILGAGSVLLGNLGSNIVAYGVPARKIRERRADEKVFDK